MGRLVAIGMILTASGLGVVLGLALLLAIFIVLTGVHFGSR